jgi:predicted RNA-binding Zn-ribbon protein involved in translation (DUF1610 family)
MGPGRRELQFRIVRIGSHGQGSRVESFPPCRWAVDRRAVKRLIATVRAEVDHRIEEAENGWRRGDGLDQALFHLANAVPPSPSLDGFLTPGGELVLKIGSGGELTREIPWEMIQLHPAACPHCGRSLPEHFWVVYGNSCPACGKSPIIWLVEKCRLSRGVDTKGEMLASGKKVLVIMDPGGDLCVERVDPTGECRRHPERIYELLKKLGYEPWILRGRQATREAVETALQDREVAAVYGFLHARYSKEAREAYLKLSDGPLYVSRIRDLHTMAWFVFLSACEAGRDPDGACNSIADAFADGPKCVIAPIARVARAYAALFAEEFFAELAGGVNVGDALAVARKASRDRYDGERLPDIGWLVYSLLGDSHLTLVESQQPGLPRPCFDTQILSVEETDVLQENEPAGVGTFLRPILRACLSSLEVLGETVVKRLEPLVHSKPDRWRVEGPACRGYFHARPYGDSEQDRRMYRRPDGADERILKMIQATSKRLVVVTGEKGVGVTSIFGARVVPEFRESGSHVVPIMLRGRDDPMRELKDQLLEPGVIWPAPDERLNRKSPTGLVRRACEDLSTQGRRLVIIFDHFERQLLSQRYDRRGARPVRQLLKAVQVSKGHVPLVVLCVRSEYKNGLADYEVGGLDLGQNWEDVQAFKYQDARQFLQDSRAAEGVLGDKVIDILLTEAARADGHDRIRPSTLHEIGAFLERYASEGGRPGWHARYLLRRDARERLRRTDTCRYARAILTGMFNSRGQKRGMVRRLMRRMGLAPSAVDKYLESLSKSRPVRRLRLAPDSGDRLWEVSPEMAALMKQAFERQQLAMRRRRTAIVSATMGIVFAVVGSVMTVSQFLPDYVPAQTAGVGETESGAPVLPTTNRLGGQVSAIDPRYVQRTGTSEPTQMRSLLERRQPVRMPDFDLRTDSADPQGVPPLANSQQLPYGVISQARAR